MDVTHKKIEVLNPRPLVYPLGGIALILFGMPAVMVLVGVFMIIAGIAPAIFMGYSRSVVDNMVLRVTVAGDDFECVMNPENMAAIHAMKAKIRGKKVTPQYSRHA